MALEAVVFAQGHFGYGQAPGLAPWCDMVGAGGFLEDWDQQLLAAPVPPNAEDQWEPVSSWDQSEASSEGKAAAPEPAMAAAATGRRKRRRTKIVKNKEEVESQRRTHIAVERNRRRQMNEYLAALRSLMPQSYAQRLRIPPLHLNVTTVDAMVLYSFSLKVEDGSKLSSVEDIAAAVHEILARIQREEEEAGRLSSSS
ncbi:unnamed protein product [Triticum turgidum subsp. durum]|uniref:BHLH domain-containing protein n=1 Tax=Triticum turgidum subsp. durum TaxID=4567 RepID=A0A9R0T9J7_TRITD|nr:unnamed protein product [Triticum turgidum subsp. durum]